MTDHTAFAEVKPGFAFEFRMTVQIGAPIEQGVWEERRRRIIPILGGTLDGARIKGMVLAGGADWQTIRLSDGAAQIYARYTLQLDDGTIVGVINPGVRRGPPEVMARIAAGEAVDPTSYYFRASPQFEVQPGPHQWLMENAFLCVGKRWPDRVDLDIYRVL